jgi:hypothetical protein
MQDFGGKARGKLTCRWMNSNPMYCREIGWCGMDWIYLAQGRKQWQAVAKMVMKFWVPENVLVNR